MPIGFESRLQSARIEDSLIGADHSFEQDVVDLPQIWSKLSAFSVLQSVR